MRSLKSASRPDSAAESSGVESHQPADQHDAGEARDRSSRRSFVFFGALAATALLPGKARAQAAGRTRQRKPFERDVPPPDGFLTVPQNEGVAAFREWDVATTSRLVRRVTLGVTPADVAKATQLGWQGYLNYQLNYARINDDAVEAAIAQKWPLMSQTSEQLFAADGGQVQTQLRESTLYRAAFSQRQLYQRMVEFWTDHFNQDIDKVGYLYVADLRDVIRKNALGNFPDLLRASAHSASMMAYLDQNASRKGAPNQNYAREIMELHTLGVDGGYTQDDVAELSRVLTGWTIQGKGQFVFNATIHDIGTKTVMGQTIAGVAGAGWNQRRRADARLPRLASEHGAVHRDEDAQVAARSESDGGADLDGSVGVQGDGRRHQGDDSRHPQRHVASRRADEAQAAVPLRRIGAAFDKSHGHHHLAGQQPARQPLASSCSRGTRPTAIPTRWSTGRGTSFRGGASVRRCRTRTRRPRCRSTRRRIAPVPPRPRSI